MAFRTLPSSLGSGKIPTDTLKALVGTPKDRIYVITKLFVVNQTSGDVGIKLRRVAVDNSNTPLVPNDFVLLAGYGIDLLDKGQTITIVAGEHIDGYATDDNVTWSADGEIVDLTQAA